MVHPPASLPASVSEAEGHRGQQPRGQAAHPGERRPRLVVGADMKHIVLASVFALAFMSFPPKTF